MTDKTPSERLRSCSTLGDVEWALKRINELSDALDAKDARIAELEAALDSHHAEVGSNIWRWWSDKARDFAQRNAMLYGDLNAKDAEIEELRRQLGGGCEANDGGDHVVIAQGRYRFCKECGETLTGVRYCHAPRQP